MKTTETVLITGASSGIGFDFAKVFASHGYDLVLVARSASKLEALAAELSERYKIKVIVIIKDLSLRTAAGEIFAEMSGRTIEVDILVNNAGFGHTGFFVDTDLSTELSMIDLNVHSLTELTKLFAVPMVARGRGKILNVASTAAFQAGPLMAIYYATKAYVLSFSEAIHDELKHNGVVVSCLCPGPTATEFQRRAGAVNTKLFSGGVMKSADVAIAGYEGLMKGKAIVIPGPRNRILVQSVRFIPRFFARRVVRKMQESKLHSGD